jgi:hypothetical protein
MSNNTNVGMLENLRKELQQTLEEKKRVDQKIVELKESLSEAIGELYALDETVKSVTHRENPAQQSSDEVKVDVGKAWSILYRWIIPIAILLALLWLTVTVSVQDGTPDGNASWETISLIPTAHACTLFERIQERQTNSLNETAETMSLPIAEYMASSAEFHCVPVEDAEMPIPYPCPPADTQEMMEHSVDDAPRSPFVRRPLLRNLFNRPLCRT